MQLNLFISDQERHVVKCEDYRVKFLMSLKFYVYGQSTRASKAKVLIAILFLTQSWIIIRSCFKEVA